MRNKSFFDKATDAIASAWLTCCIALFIAAPVVALHFIFKFW